MACLLLAAGCARSTRDGAAADLPVENLVFVTVDTLRADHVGFNGYRLPTTPNLDRLARSGAVFTQAVAQSSWTRASVASYMTGLYPTTLGLTCHNFRLPKADCDRLPQSATTLAELLQAGGFTTAGVVANINVDGVFGFDQGYDEFTSVAERLAEDDPDWRLHSDWFDETTRAVTDHALAFLDAHAGRGKRFLLNLHYLDPHDPYAPPPEQKSVFEARSYDVDPRSREAIARYDGEIRHVDEQFQRVLERLDTLGLTETTGVILLADHGEEFHDHGGVRHGYTMYDEQIRVPLIVKLPGRTAPGTRIDQQVRLLDVMPTVLDALGLEAPEPLQGTSLLPLLAGAKFPSLPALSEWGYRRLVSYRDPPWKLIYDIETEAPMLFHLERDPLERNDLRHAEPRVTARLTARMTDLLASALETAERIPPDSGKIQLTQTQVDQLKALGYVD
jgi:arylsulfatase A-like enzyme